MSLKATVEGKNLVITIPMQEPKLSKSGKSLLVASTNGMVATDVIVQGKPVTIGLNAFIKA